ncbi:hypothetical protein BJ956_000504 [Arthrobacter psychrochitiniphilus]|nr:hypothetical protein [Arthrobacter psychrochitiniphilus]
MATIIATNGRAAKDTLDLKRITTPSDPKKAKTGATLGAGPSNESQLLTQLH